MGLLGKPTILGNPHIKLMLGDGNILWKKSMLFFGNSNSAVMLSKLLMQFRWFNHFTELEPFIVQLKLEMS